LETHPNHHKPIKEKDEGESEDSERERERENDRKRIFWVSGAKMLFLII